MSAISYENRPVGISPGAVVACIPSDGGGGGAIPTEGMSPPIVLIVRTHSSANAAIPCFIVLLLLEVLDDAKTLTSAGNRATSRSSCKGWSRQLLSAGVSGSSLNSHLKGHLA